MIFLSLLYAACFFCYNILKKHGPAARGKEGAPMSIRQRLSTLLRAVPRPVRDLIITVSFLAGAYLVSVVLLHFTGDEDNSALVFVLAVVCVSFFTTGYRYGIAASIAGAFCINYFFMYP